MTQESMITQQPTIQVQQWVRAKYQDRTYGLQHSHGDTIQQKLQWKDVENRRELPALLTVNIKAWDH